MRLVTVNRRNIKLLPTLLTTGWLLLAPMAFSNELLTKAISEYNRGNYPNAIGLFGQAESTEFNNPILHYYLANALAKTNQKADAIKEYKVALAMAPQGQMAAYCRQGLVALGEKGDDTGAAKKPKTGTGPLAFTYTFDARGIPTDIEGKFAPDGSYRLHKMSEGVWTLKEIRHAKDLVICTIPVPVRLDGRIIGTFFVDAQGDMTYTGADRVRHVIHPDGSVEDPSRNRPNAISQTGSGGAEVVVTLCGCPLCHRIELIVVDLRRKYGDRVRFTVSSTDTHTASSAITADCPQVQFMNGSGRSLFTETGNIQEPQLYKDVEMLLADGLGTPTLSAADRSIAQQVLTITQEAEVRIAESQVQLTRQIQQIREDERLSQLEDRYRRTDSSSQSSPDHRIQYLKQDFERKQKDIRAAAKSRIEALSGGSYGAQSGNDRPRSR